MKKVRYIFFLFALFMITNFCVYSQGDNWYSTPCSGGSSYYKDFGLITPTGSSQGASFNGTNYSTGTNAFWKGSFVVAAAQEHYCFQLYIYGSGYPYGASGGNGSEILILDKACGTASQTIKADFYTGYTAVPNQLTQCGCWTSSAADVGKTYYIELSEGAGGGELFGAAGSVPHLGSDECGGTRAVPFRCGRAGTLRCVAGRTRSQDSRWRTSSGAHFPPEQVSKPDAQLGASVSSCGNGGQWQCRCGFTGEREAGGGMV